MFDRGCEAVGIPGSFKIIARSVSDRIYPRQVSVMDGSQLGEIAVEGLYLILLLSAPLLSLALLTGIIVGWLSHYTKLSEPAIGNLARLLAVMGGLLPVAPWIGDRTVQFAQKTWALLLQMVS